MWSFLFSRILLEWIQAEWMESLKKWKTEIPRENRERRHFEQEDIFVISFLKPGRSPGQGCVLFQNKVCLPPARPGPTAAA